MQVDKSEQRAITRLCIQCALYLLQHGAESALVRITGRYRPRLADGNDERRLQH